MLTDVQIRFRSTPPHGGRLWRRLGPCSPRRFRSTPPHGGRPWRSRSNSARCASFDPRPRMEGDPTAIERLLGLAGFRSTPPHGGRPHVLDNRLVAEVFRSTPPHGGRLGDAGLRQSAVSVSIHAPAWRATNGTTFVTVAMEVSIHAPAWRATRVGTVRLGLPRCFDPRPRMEGDPPAHRLMAVLRRFDPRPRMEGDRPGSVFRSFCKVFRSTPPHGGRRQIRRHAAEPMSEFRSTPPHGGRPPIHSRLQSYGKAGLMREPEILPIASGLLAFGTL